MYARMAVESHRLEFVGLTHRTCYPQMLDRLAQMTEMFTKLDSWKKSKIGTETIGGQLSGGYHTGDPPSRGSPVAREEEIGNGGAP